MAAAPQAPGRGSVRKTRPLTVKTSLNNPYTLCWSALESEDMHFILQTLEDRFKSLGLKKIEDKKRKKKQPFLKKQSRDNCSTDVDVREDLKKKAEDTLQVSGWTPVHVRGQLAIGVNEVTRALHKTAFEPIHRHNSVTSVPSIKNVPFLENGKISPLHQEIAKSLKIRGMCFLYPFIPPTNG